MMKKEMVEDKEKEAVEIQEEDLGFDHTEETLDELSNGKGDDE